MYSPITTCVVGMRTHRSGNRDGWCGGFGIATTGSPDEHERVGTLFSLLKVSSSFLPRSLSFQQAEIQVVSRDHETSRIPGVRENVGVGGEMGAKPSKPSSEER